MIKKLTQLCTLLSVFVFFAANVTSAQTILINHNFQTSTLPAGVTSDGVISPTKAADGVCSQGMIQINGATSSLPSQYLQIDVTSCGVFRMNMKSTSSSARTVTVKYKKSDAENFSNATTSLSVSTAASYNLTTLYPELLSSGPITFRIETVGNIQVHDLYVEASNIKSNAADITAFKLPNQIGNEVINTTNNTVDINMPLGTNLTAVVPQNVVISGQATISPATTVAQDFSQQKEVSYTVTAQDGTTQKIWKVKVKEIASSAKEIVAFKLSNSQIGEASITSDGNIAVTMPQSADLTNVVPVTLSIAPFASISPSANTARNFTQPVSYTVTAQDNSTKVWTVTVTKVDPNATFTIYEAEDGEFTGNVDNQHAGFTGSGFVDFLATGENYMIFTVCQTQAGVQTAKFRYSLAKDDIRSGSLYVNDVFIKTLAFTRTATFTDWSEEIVNLSLQAGINKIKITWETTDGPNLDKLSITGLQCSSYNVNVTTTNGGKVSLSPVRTGNKYFQGETVTLLAENKPNLLFENWSEDASGSTNPLQVTMNSNKNITAIFKVVNTYKLNVTINGIGEVLLSPAGGEYADGTVVTLRAKSVLGSTFQGWSSNLSGTDSVATITMNAVKNVTATFTSSIVINFNKVVGFASITADNFTGPTTGGSTSTDTVFIKGPTEFGKLCQVLQDRIKYKAYSSNPLTIVLEEGTYTGAGGQLSVWANSMLTIQEQGNLTIIGRKNVIFNFGINVKRSFNLIIRNITFQDYYDDGINIGETETHHIWVDHCTVGHPTTLPANTEHPDGGIDVKAGSSYVTISWTKYRNSWKTGLVGHSDNNASEDVGRLKVTYFANHFYGTNSRNPRVRFGEVHILNNLEERVMLYGIAAANGSKVYAENNFFLNTDWPMYADRTSADFKAVYGNNSDNTYTSKTGNYPALGLKQVGNEYDDSGLPVITAMINPNMLNPGGRSIKFDEFNPQAVFNPRSYYEYDAYPANVVRTIVPLFAGADKVDFWAIKNAALPLTLISFSGNYDNNKVTLKWKTTNELQVSSYKIERSNNGTDFSTIGSVAAKNSTTATEYNFIDDVTINNKVFYRLKMIDNDGAVKYSNIITFSNQSNNHFSVYPNPAKDVFTITHKKFATPQILQIFTSNGSKVISKQIAAGTSNTIVNIGSIPSGIYWVRILDAKMQQVKLVVNK